MSTTTDWIAVARELGPSFAERAAAHDADDSFVAENYAELKDRGLFAAGVPGELGGGDASHADLCAVVRELARSCGSTALAFSMHTHNVATQSHTTSRRRRSVGAPATRSPRRCSGAWPPRSL